MADVRKIIEEAGKQILNNLLNPSGAKTTGQAAGHTAKTIDDLSLDDLRKEKIRFDQEERKMLARLREVEAEKKKLFEDGVRTAGEREQRVIARRIKEKDVEAANMDRMLQVISQQMRIINGLLQVKERSRLVSESGMSELLKNIDLKDLISYIDKSSVDGEFHEDKFDELLRAMEEAGSISPVYKEDQDVMDIMKAMQQAREASDSPEALEKQFESMSEQMKQKQQEKAQERGEAEL